MRPLRTLLVAAGLVIAAAAPAVAAPPSSDHRTNAQMAAQWLAGKVNASGYIESAYVPGTADLSTTAQAVPALVAAGLAGPTTASMIGYLSSHVDDLVSDGTADKSGSLANLILAVVAAGGDPHAFGTPSTDLVARLLATVQGSGPDAGLFGSQDATYDGAYRQGLSLLALRAAGAAAPASAVAWLEAQQCPSGLWAPYRSDLNAACPVVDPAAFAGPDTNTTAVAVLGLLVGPGSSAAGAGAAGLEAVRNADGGWGYLARADQATDANSTGLVLDALRAAKGPMDLPGVAALEALQIGCSGAAGDVGGVAFQPQGTSLFPDAFATTQAVPALAGTILPVLPGQLAVKVADPCAAAAPVSTTTTTSTTVDPVAAPTTTVVAASVAGTVTTGGQLARSGSDSGPLVVVGLLLIAGGALTLVVARRRLAPPGA